VIVVSVFDPTCVQYPDDAFQILDSIGGRPVLLAAALILNVLTGEMSLIHPLGSIRNRIVASVLILRAQYPDVALFTILLKKLEDQYYWLQSYNWLF
jgi:hypothetical protein